MNEKKRPYDLLIFDLQGTLAETGSFLDGTVDMLKMLKARGYLIAAATNWGKRSLEHLLETLPSDFSFDAVRYAGSIPSKPDPQMLFEILQELNMKSSQALMIGDTVTDIEFAHNAEVDILSVSYSGTPERLLMSYEPIGCVDSIKALKAWFYLN